MNSNKIANLTLSLLEIKYKFVIIYYTSLVFEYRLDYAVLMITCLVISVGITASAGY